MDPAKQATIIESIRETLGAYVGRRLSIRANMGRSKIVVSEGTLVQVHPQLFVMDVDRKRGRTARQSYQYADVLTGTVELSQDGAPLFGDFIEEENAALAVASPAVSPATPDVDKVRFEGQNA